MDRFTWGVVAAVLVLVVAGVGTAAAVRGREVPPDLSTPSGVTLAYTLAVQRGDGVAAWDLLASATQASARRDQFLLRVGAGTGRDDPARTSVEDERVSGETATVSLVRSRPGSGGPGSLLFGDGGYTDRNPVGLVREGGEWKLRTPPEPYLLDRRGGD